MRGLMSIIFIPAVCETVKTQKSLSYTNYTFVKQRNKHLSKTEENTQILKHFKVTSINSNNPKL